MIGLQPSTLGIFFALCLQSHALSTVPGSPCSDVCADAVIDGICTDQEFNSTSGVQLSQCITCLHGSDYRSGFMTDSSLFLHYVSNVQQSCLGSSDNTGSCSSKCSALPTSFPTGNGRNQFQNPYSYCSANNNAYSNDAADCAQCLQSEQGSVILGNFVNVGNAGCETQPSVQEGAQISFDGDLFSTATTKSSSANDSNSAATTSGVLAASSATVTPEKPSSITVVLTATVALGPSSTAESANASSDQSGFTSPTLSRGAAAGVGLALGLVGIATIIFFAILLRRRLLRKGSNFTRMPSPAMAKRSATPPAAGVFVPPGFKSSHTAAAAAAVGAFARAGIGKSIAREKTENEKPTTTDEVDPKHSKSFKSITSKSWKSKNLTPRTSTWFHAANPKQSSELTALPQPWITPGMDGIPEVPSSRGTAGRGWD